MNEGHHLERVPIDTESTDVVEILVPDQVTTDELPEDVAQQPGDLKLVT
jgi:hypothetical protein